MNRCLQSRSNFCLTRICIAIGVVVVGGCNPGGSQATSASLSQETEASPAPRDPNQEDPEAALKLAIIDADGYVASDDPRVEKYDNMLKALQEKWGNTGRNLGEMLVVCHKELKEKGIEESLLDLGWHIDEQVSKAEAEKLGKDGLTQVATLYVLSRIGNR